MRKPNVGDKLYSLNIGNAARHCEQVLTEVIVKKVGRKYFIAGIADTSYADRKYLIDSWYQENDGYIADSLLYETKEEYETECETRVICQKISKIFEYGKNTKSLSLKKLRDIIQIIEN